MTITLKYGSRVAAVPLEAVTPFLCNSSRTDLAVLLSVAAQPELSAEERAAAIDAAREDVLASLARWQARGVLTVTLAGDESLPAVSCAGESTAEREKPKKILQKAQLPTYSTEETARILEGCAGLPALIDACQQIMGRIFSTSDINTLIGLVDYLSLSNDYILLLASWCARWEKRSMRYLEKMAISLFDQGLTGYAELEDYLARRDAVSSEEGNIRRLFGFGSRALTQKERAFLDRWIGEWHLPMDMIAHAYEITMDTTKGKAGMAYTDRVLERWHTAGYRTLAEVTAGEDRRGKAAGEDRRGKTAGQFDTDAFFEAALSRSYGDMKPPCSVPEQKEES